jgi:XTP/dITP diphosphohydrolase
VKLSGEVVVATGNAGKLAEFRRLFEDWPVTLRAQSEFAVVPAEENAPSFVENAILKARAASAQTGLPALADDSGLAVDALGGAPGVRSARFAADAGSLRRGEDKDAANRRQLLVALEGVAEDARGASFHCALVFLRHAQDPTPIIAEGVWPGDILCEERGDGGFGYDPLFLLRDLGLSAAELPAMQKNCLSHRGQAVAALMARLGSA